MRRFAWFFGMILVGAVWISQASAADLKGKYGAGVTFFYDHYLGHSGQDYEATNYDLDMEYLMHGGVSLTYFATSEYSIEVAVEYDKSKLKYTEEGLPQEDVGDLVQVPVTVAFRIMPPFSEKWKPYLGVGAGYVFNDYRADYLDDIRKFENDFIFFISLGNELRVTDALSVCLEGRYVLGEATWRRPLGLFYEHLDMDTIQGSMSLKWYFDKNLE